MKLLVPFIIIDGELFEAGERPTHVPRCPACNLVLGLDGTRIKVFVHPGNNCDQDRICNAIRASQLKLEARKPKVTPAEQPIVTCAKRVKAKPAEQLDPEPVVAQEPIVDSPAMPIVTARYRVPCIECGDQIELNMKGVDVLVDYARPLSRKWISIDGSASSPFCCASCARHLPIDARLLCARQELAYDALMEEYEAIVRFKDILPMYNVKMNGEIMRHVYDCEGLLGLEKITTGPMRLGQQWLYTYLTQEGKEFSEMRKRHYP